MISFWSDGKCKEVSLKGKQTLKYELENNDCIRKNQNCSRKAYDSSIQDTVNKKDLKRKKDLNIEFMFHSQLEKTKSTLKIIFHTFYFFFKHLSYREASTDSNTNSFNSSQECILATNLKKDKTNSRSFSVQP